MSKEKSPGKISSEIRHLFGHDKLLWCVVLGCLNHTDFGAAVVTVVNVLKL